MPLDYLKKLCRPEKPVLADVKAIFDRKAALELGFTVFRL
jgi:UDP-N-acetyl-D-galactosamine dehydrogenase